MKLISYIIIIIYSQSKTKVVTMTNESVSAPIPSAAAAAINKPTGSSSNSITPLQLTMAAIILGTSAGLTLYTKKTSAMLQTMEKVNKNVAQRKGPPKFGPRTKMEWEKWRNRWEKDDL